MAADLVITGAALFDHPGVTAVSVTDGRISALGAAAEALIGSSTRVLTTPGGLVLPGFVDAHVHAPFAGRNLNCLWLNDTEGKSAYLQQIANYAAAHPELPWIVGGGWAMEYFPGGTPDRRDLDAVVGDRPVFLMNRDVHGAWVNTRALEIAGIDEHTPDPIDGRYERDTHGYPTGTLHEGAAYAFDAVHVPRPDLAEWRAAIVTAQRHLHSLGITGWQDAWVTPDTLAAYRDLGDDGGLTARVVGALWWDRHAGLEQLELFAAQREHGAAPNFSPTTVKIMADGVMENYTGALLEPYCSCVDHRGAGKGNSTGSGLSYVDPDTLQRAVTALDAAGFQVHMHAIGDRAARDCLNAVERARTTNGPNDLRHHIAHLQLVHPDDLPRFAALDVVANLQAYWAQHEPQMDALTIPFLGERRAALQFPFADLVAQGTRIAMGSDWAVTTADPLAQIEVAITRRDPDHRDGEPFLPWQALDLDTALRAFTAGSAYVNHDPSGGRIAVGARADLAVLDLDITRSAHLPTDAVVVTTIAGGAVVHHRGDH
ncbi:amidohydrolase [Gordonia sp. i37]|uniref:amidohydrolase n=1 Tax=Gordonia sp. i37 TaxID=1961707 RepID=UPI0009AD2DE4|nr:amidohydrolase [Gordonia sp. i37]OPX17168.1 amidohydrolase [Gordonia sp. i37]